MVENEAVTKNKKRRKAITFFVKEKRIERGLSMSELAELSGLSKSFISLIEAGKKTPSVETLCRLSIAFECDFEELYKFEPEKGE